LTVGGEVPNTMTIGWVRSGFLEPSGVRGGVRPSRHTYGMLMKAGVFTVSVPMRAT
jgi:flavin reductase (DIM6/NTAB) family NADH-FMN oxidoreductase RutF